MLRDMSSITTATLSELQNNTCAYLISPNLCLLVARHGTAHGSRSATNIPTWFAVYQPSLIFGLCQITYCLVFWFDGERAAEFTVSARVFTILIILLCSNSRSTVPFISVRILDNITVYQYPSTTKEKIKKWKSTPCSVSTESRNCV